MNKTRRLIIIAIIFCGFAGRSFAFTSVAKSTVTCEVVFGAVDPDPDEVEASIGPEGGTLSIFEPNSSTQEASVVIPSGALETYEQIIIRRLDTNALPQPVDGNIVAAYEFLPAGLQFKVPVTITLFYDDADHDGIVDGTGYSAAGLKIMVLEGSVWRILGGNVDTANNSVSWQVTHFSIYALYHAVNISDADYRTKDRIISPLQAGYGKARFTMLSDGDSINIYDVTGRRVRRITQAPFEWDGRDDDNKVVESGVYIYQIKAAGKTISGTIAVAK